VKLLFDTSVLVAAMLETHPDHAAALPWLRQIKDGTHQGVVSAHALAELYAILTRLPIRPKISAKLAGRLIKDNVLDVFEVIPLSAADYLEIIDYLSENNVIGGVTYDALHLQAAWKTNVDQVITINDKDFRRIYPHFADKIVSPKN
jgi:predicted nucleic acid-binding protein